MAHVWFSVADCPDQGRRLTISDQNVWTDPLAEFQIQAGITEPLTAELVVTPHGEGLLVQGHLQGCVSFSCDRCADNAAYAVDARFDIFESVQEPGEEEEINDRFRQGRHGLELDLAAVLWEQFILALPVKPLCSEDCQGICSQCGANLNHGDCGCDHDAPDPRLEVLRRLHVGGT
ncbi:MAG: DUF177 domain-containing protein [Desulfovermiculus sp.]